MTEVEDSPKSEEPRGLIDVVDSRDLSEPPEGLKEPEDSECTEDFGETDSQSSRDPKDLEDTQEVKEILPFGGRSLLAESKEQQIDSFFMPFIETAISERGRHDTEKGRELKKKWDSFMDEEDMEKANEKSVEFVSDLMGLDEKGKKKAKRMQKIMAPLFKESNMDRICDTVKKKFDLQKFLNNPVNALKNFLMGVGVEVSSMIEVDAPESRILITLPPFRPESLKGEHAAAFKFAVKQMAVNAAACKLDPDLVKRGVYVFEKERAEDRKKRKDSWIWDDSSDSETSGLLEYTEQSESREVVRGTRKDEEDQREQKLVMKLIEYKPGDIYELELLKMGRKDVIEAIKNYNVLEEVIIAMNVESSSGKRMEFYILRDVNKFEI